MTDTSCPRTRALEERLAVAEALLLDAAWALRHLSGSGEQAAQAHVIGVQLQEWERGWHERRQLEQRAHCTLAHAAAAGGLRA